MSRLTLGVIGHVDHGKTALVRALTGMETDRLAEEKRRGISITLGFAHMVVDGTSIDLVDMPGHERFIRTMVSGATGIDAVLLVVAANEGVMPQTREHVHIAGLLGVARALVAVTKADLVSGEEAAVAGLEAAEFAAAAGLAAGEPVVCSALTGQGMDALRAGLAALAAGTRPRPDLGLPWLPVDRAFSIAGHGTVVTGTLRRGRLVAGQEALLLPEGRRVRVRSLQVHGARVDEAAPGERVAANLRGAEVAQAGRGTALAEAHDPPAPLAPARWLTVQVRAVADAPPIGTTVLLRLLYGTDEVDARLRLLDRDVLHPGETALAQLRCAAPVAVPGRERFILRAASPSATLAGGLVLDPQAQRLRRHAPGVLARLAALLQPDPATELRGIARGELAASGTAGLTVARLARLAGVGLAQAAACLGGLDAVLCGSAVAVPRSAFAAVQARVAELLGAAPGALARDQLLAHLPGTSAPVLTQALAALVSTGTVRQQGGGYQQVHAARDQARQDRQKALADRLSRQLHEGGLTPPDLWALAPDTNARSTLDRLVREGTAVRGHDESTKRDFLFHQDAIDHAQTVLRPLLEQGPGLLVREVGAALGISRKYSMPLLHHLDAIRFTVRVGDRRQLRRG